MKERAPWWRNKKEGDADSIYAEGNLTSGPNQSESETLVEKRLRRKGPDINEWQPSDEDRAQWHSQAELLHKTLTPGERDNLLEAGGRFVELKESSSLEEAASEAAVGLSARERTALYNELAASGFFATDEVVRAQRSELFDRAMTSLSREQLGVYEEKLAQFKKKYGAPYGEEAGALYWKEGDGSAQILEPSGDSYHLNEGAPHGFQIGTGPHYTRFWTSAEGFVPEERVKQVLAESHKKDTEEYVEPTGAGVTFHEQADDDLKEAIENAKESEVESLVADLGDAQEFAGPLKSGLVFDKGETWQQKQKRERDAQERERRRQRGKNRGQNPGQNRTNAAGNRQ